MNYQNLDIRHRAKSLDRKLDQWISTGRQVVDGVAGNRPGKRNNQNINRSKSVGISKVGEWVEDKLEWLLEDEDDFVESWERDPKEAYSASKRPLEAISRRLVLPNDIEDNSYLNTSSNDDQWPDDSSFRIGKWERKDIKPTNSTNVNNKKSEQLSNSTNRPLPRSSRRRY